MRERYLHTANRTTSNNRITISPPTFSNLPFMPHITNALTSFNFHTLPLLPLRKGGGGLNDQWVCNKDPETCRVQLSIWRLSHLQLLKLLCQKSYSNLDLTTIDHPPSQKVLHKLSTYVELSHHLLSRTEITEVILCLLSEVTIIPFLICLSQLLIHQVIPCAFPHCHSAWMHDFP